MKKITKQVDVIRLMSDGWRLEKATNYNNERVLSYYLCKRNYSEEFKVGKPLRNSLYSSGLIDGNNELTKAGNSFLIKTHGKIEGRNEMEI